MAARAVDLCVALLYEEACTETVARVLRDHGETGTPPSGGEGGPAAGGAGMPFHGSMGRASPGGGPATGADDAGGRPAAGGEGGAGGGPPPGEAGGPYLDEGDVAAMREAAARLVEVFAAPGPDAAAAVLNRLLAETGRGPRLTDHGGTTAWHLHVDSHDDAPWAEWFLASSAMALAVLLADHQRVPGGLCASAGCRRPYLDLGGGSPRRYCSTRCATRERVAAHRSRALTRGCQDPLPAPERRP